MAANISVEVSTGAISLLHKVIPLNYGWDPKSGKRLLITGGLESGQCLLLYL